MNNKTIHQQIEDAIIYRAVTGSNELFTPLIRQELERLYINDVEITQDYRSGEDSYGYDDVDLTLEYIIDRWNAGFRIKWIIDGLANGKI